VTLVLHILTISRSAPGRSGAWKRPPRSWFRAPNLFKENCHVRIHPRGSLTRAVSARPRACCCPVGANSETGFGGEETTPLDREETRAPKAYAPAPLRMCDSRPSAEQSNGMKI